MEVRSVIGSTCTHVGLEPCEKCISCICFAFEECMLKFKHYCWILFHKFKFLEYMVT